MQCQQWMLLDIPRPLSKSSLGAIVHVMGRFMRTCEYIGFIRASLDYSPRPVDAQFCSLPCVSRELYLRCVNGLVVKYFSV